MTTNRTLIACRECDCLQQEAALQARGAAQCARCGACLYRYKPHGLDHTLAFLAAAAILFVIATSFPLLSLDAQGLTTTTTLFGTAQALYEGGDTSVAALVFMTTILFPAVEIAAMLYMLAALKLGYVPRTLPLLFLAFEAVKPWGMTSVFMLGTLVSMVKLAHIATVIPGIALVALGGLIMMIAATEATYDPRALWRRVREVQA
jgi:paraquat-inducible protein A